MDKVKYRPIIILSFEKFIKFKRPNFLNIWLSTLKSEGTLKSEDLCCQVYGNSKRRSFGIPIDLATQTR